jgi:hypothetical protein
MDSVREINLFKFYQCSQELGKLKQLDQMAVKDAWVLLMNAQSWMFSFMNETKAVPMKNTDKAIEKLRETVAKIYARIAATTDIQPIEDIERYFIINDLEDFESEFEIDSRYMGVFCVTQKGDKSIRILIEEPESKFPHHLITVMPHKTIQDIREAAKCLTFERATACAFHVCRATEGLMRAYYKKLTGFDWPPPSPPKPKLRKEWKVLVDQLRGEGAPMQIIQRLDEIREDRNSFAHPDVSVASEDAVVVYDLCTNIMHLIAEEMKK